MPLGVEPRDVAHLAGQQHQLVARHQLGDTELVALVEGERDDRAFGSGQLPKNVAGGHGREGLDQMLGERAPVVVRIAATLQLEISGNRRHPAGSSPCVTNHWASTLLSSAFHITYECPNSKTCKTGLIARFPAQARPN